MLFQSSHTPGCGPRCRRDCSGRAPPVRSRGARPGPDGRLVVLSLRGDYRRLRAGGKTLLDLVIVTGSVLLFAALLLQRFGPQVKGGLGDEPPEALA